MKIPDEMDRNIQLRSEERGYKAILAALCLWTLINLYQSYATRTKLEMLPCLLLCLAICVQAFSQMAMKRRMVAGDEEYREPNKLLHTVIWAVVIAVVVLALGAHFLLKA